MKKNISYQRPTSQVVSLMELLIHQNLKSPAWFWRRKGFPALQSASRRSQWLFDFHSSRTNNLE